MAYEESRGDFKKIMVYYGLMDADTDRSFIMTQCPIHGDTNPSFKINFERLDWKCFGCERSGTSIELISLLENVDPITARMRRQQILNSNEMKHIRLGETVKKREFDNDDLINIYKDYYNNLPHVNWMNTLSEELQKCLDYMIKRGFYPQTMNIAGAKYTFNDMYPLVFPMHQNGVYVGHIRRTITEDKSIKRKYLNPAGYMSNRHLIGETRGNLLYITEGYLDYLKLVQFGQRNSCCLLKWKISKDQIATIKEHGITRVVSALDNDDKGNEGTCELEEHFEVVRFPFQSLERNIKDMGDLTRREFESVQELIR